MTKILNRNDESLEAVETNTQRKEELKLARTTRNIYEQQLKRANDLFMEACAIRLQLDQREKAIDEWVFLIGGFLILVSLIRNYEKKYY